MSKIGKKIILLPQGVAAEFKNNEVVFTGPKGTITVHVSQEVGIEIKKEDIKVTLKKNEKSLSAIYGTTRSILANAVLGVTQGWSKQLELVGTGFRAEVNGKTLILTVGYSHPVKIEAPDGISFKVEKNVVTVDGINKELVGHLAAKIRAVRPPEPYQGKGIKYIDEIIRRKAGKAAKTVGAA